MAIVEDLIVSERGAFVGLHGGRLRVSVKDTRLVDAPLMHLRSVQVLTRSASFSAAALSACCEHGVPVHFVDAFDGNYATVLSSKLTTVVTTRRCQIEAVKSESGVEIARQIGIGKIRSQANNLRYLSRRLDEDLQHTFKQTALEMLDYTRSLEELEAFSIEDVRAEMMGIEGYCARRYWQVLGHLIPQDYAWTGRIGRHATDPVNTLLNYGYGILYGEVQNALMIAGLEPYVGLIHTDRPGKPSLTFDLIEEFRAPVVDRTVIGLVNRRYEVCYDSEGRLEREFRKNYAEHILSRLNAQGNFGGKRYQLRSIIQLQARALAAAMRGECEYQPYGGI